MDGSDPSHLFPPPLPVPSLPVMYNTPRGDVAYDLSTKLWMDANVGNKQWLTQAVSVADTNRDLSERQKAVEDVLDGFDTVSPTFTNADVTHRVFLVMSRTVAYTAPQFVQDEPLNLFRKTVLRLIHRIVILDCARPLHDAIIPQLIQVIDNDNEDNAIQCMKTLMEIIKIYRTTQPPSPIFSNQALVAFVVKLCKRWTNLPRMLNKVLDMQQVKPVISAAGAVDLAAAAAQIITSVVINNSPSSVGEPPGNPITLLPTSSSSLRFLSESTMIIMFSQNNMRVKIDEMYPTFGQDAINIMLAELDVSGVEQFIEGLKDKPHEQARVLGAYHEFMITYCKVPQLFAYAARNFCKNVQDYSVFGRCVVRLLTICPKEIVWGRREIFGAIKQVASHDWKEGLIPFIPQLLDLDFLLGPSHGCREILKATAVSMALDMLHYLRGHLSLTVFEKVINLMVAYFADRSLGIQLHGMLLRTMSTNLSESVIAAARAENKLEEGRTIFLRVLNVLGLRLKVMVKYSLPIYKQKLKSAASQGSVLEPNEIADNSSHLLLEQRQFLRSIVTAIRTFLYCVKECSSDGNPFIRPEDLKVLTRICKYSVQATELFVIGTSGPSAAKMVAAQTGKPLEKDFTENLADTMKAFPFDVYRDIFQHMFWRFLDLFKDEQLQQILTAVLNALIPYSGYSGITTTTMLDVGVARFPELAEASNDVSLSVLKIFKILFGAVSLYPKEVEQYFKPLLQKIFHQGFALCMRARDPYNLLLMFRAFFRAMGGGGHEVLYQDFLPNLPMILQVGTV
ncbi:putative Transcription-associated protein 1 [Hypsibius exemplaris]|uniref:Transcription-associated protein 1 n=1 Tax=Hypsibius exemplaris TaxID=2072580 RepID=A0A1W0WAJ2_HYPEX|nr:putative Transcription-associated protein 1 [Hypsibius exemplaris]